VKVLPQGKLAGHVSKKPVVKKKGMPLAGPKMPKNAFFEASDAFQSLRCFSKPQMSFQSFQSHKCSDESLTTGSSRHT
jgi:hypothetical protein